MSIPLQFIGRVDLSSSHERKILQRSMHPTCNLFMVLGAQLAADQCREPAALKQHLQLLCRFPLRLLTPRHTHTACPSLPRPTTCSKFETTLGKKTNNDKR
jgi:hypothetical protein